jgi:hypothetical protein
VAGRVPRLLQPPSAMDNSMKTAVFIGLRLFTSGR